MAAGMVVVPTIGLGVRASRLPAASHVAAPSPRTPDAMARGSCRGVTPETGVTPRFSFEQGQQVFLSLTG